MKRVLQVMLVAALAVVVASPTWADDKEEKKVARQAQKGKQGQVIAGPLAGQLEKVNLTDEQKKQLEEITTKYAAKVQEARQAINAVITKEIRQARTAATEKARAEGKKGADLKAAVEAAAALNDDQKKALTDAEGKMKEVQVALRQEVLAILTDEQKEAAGLNKPAQGAKKKGNRPEKGAKPAKNADKGDDKQPK